MLLAEFTVSPVGWVHRWARNRWLMAGIGVVAYLIAASPLAGPEGLTPATLGQFVVRTAMGAVLAGALLAPLVLDRPDTPHRILASPVMVTLGRWSYGLFVWHLAALAMAFPLVGRFVFNGDMPVILVLTAGVRVRDGRGQLRACGEPVPAGAAPVGYRSERRVPPLDSSVTDAPEPAVAQ